MVDIWIDLTARARTVNMFYILLCAYVRAGRLNIRQMGFEGRVELGQLCHEVDHGIRCKIMCLKYRPGINSVGTTMFAFANTPIFHAADSTDFHLPL